MLITDMNGVLSCHGSKKTQPWNCWQEEEGQCMRGRIAQPVTVSWATTSSVHLPLIAPAAETWILLTLAGGDHYKKDTKNMKEIDRSFFEMLNLGITVRSSALAVLSVKQEPMSQLATGQCSKGTFAGERKQNCTMKSPEGSGSEKLGSCAPLFCQSFGITHGTCHLTCQCLSSSI